MLYISMFSSSCEDFRVVDISECELEDSFFFSDVFYSEESEIEDSDFLPARHCHEITSSLLDYTTVILN